MNVENEKYIDFIISRKMSATKSKFILLLYSYDNFSRNIIAEYLSYLLFYSLKKYSKLTFHYICSIQTIFQPKISYI